MSDPHPRPVRAGLVPWRRGPDGRLLVGLVREHEGFGLPDGQVDGRHPLATALRTLRPAARLGPPGPRFECRGLAGAPESWYWPVEVVGGHETFDWRAPDDVPRGTAWEAVAATTAHLTQASSTSVRQVVLVRHARAGQRSRWVGPDADRPLDEQGRTQAAALADLLPAFGVQRIHSADTRRCLETVGPLGAALGLPVIEEPLLSEDGSADDPDGALRLAADLVARPGQSVLCTQRKTLARVLPDLLRQLGLEPDGAQVPRKGGLLVLHLSVDEHGGTSTGARQTAARSVEALEPPAF